MHGLMACGRGCSKLTLALDGGGWSASRLSDFTAGRDIWYPLNGSLGGAPLPEIEPQTTPSIASPLFTNINMTF
jgi:hypothetical protein